MENLSQVGEREYKALLRIGAASNVRLACQAQCQKDDIRIVPLLPAKVNSQKARKEDSNTVGRDVEPSVMFVDLRSITSLSEGNLPMMWHTS
jgi:adenylate cyclase